MNKTTGTPQLMKTMNRAAIIGALVRNRPISQTQICQLTGLSRATVSILVKELKQDDLIAAVNKEVSRGGRRQTMLELNENAGFVVGVDLGGTKMAGAVTNLYGRSIAEMRWPTHAAEGPEAVLDALIRFIEALIRKAGVASAKVWGVGIGVPGVVRPGGIVEWAPNLKWRNLDLETRIAAAVGRPVFIENDVNLLALGEYWYGAARGAQTMACLAVGTGIGAGLIINGQLYTGVHQAAGEVCNLLVDRSYLGQDFSQLGCLELLASGPALAAQYAHGLHNRNPNQKAGFPAKEDLAPPAGGDAIKPSGAEVVFSEAARQNRLAQKIVEGFSRNIAMAIVAITTVLDPDVIVLGGGVSQNAALFRERIVELCRPVVPVMPRVEVSALGATAGVMGAVALILYHSNPNILAKQDC